MQYPREPVSLLLTTQFLIAYSLQLQYHLYSTQLPHTSNLQPNQRNHLSFFMSDSLREDIQKRMEAVYQTADTQSDSFNFNETRVYLKAAESFKIPSEVHNYHSLCPLEDLSKARMSKAFGVQSTVYKAISSVDGMPYILRRLEGMRLPGFHADLNGILRFPIE